MAFNKCYRHFFKQKQYNRLFILFLGLQPIVPAILGINPICKVFLKCTLDLLFWSVACWVFFQIIPGTGQSQQLFLYFYGGYLNTSFGSGRSIRGVAVQWEVTSGAGLSHGDESRRLFCLPNRFANGRFWEAVGMGWCRRSRPRRRAESRAGTHAPHALLFISSLPYLQTTFTQLNVRLTWDIDQMSSSTINSSALAVHPIFNIWHIIQTRQAYTVVCISIQSCFH